MQVKLNAGLAHSSPGRCVCGGQPFTPGARGSPSPRQVPPRTRVFMHHQAPRSPLTAGLPASNPGPDRSGLCSADAARKVPAPCHREGALPRVPRPRPTQVTLRIRCLVATITGLFQRRVRTSAFLVSPLPCTSTRALLLVPTSQITAQLAGTAPCPRLSHLGARPEGSASTGEESGGSCQGGAGLTHTQLSERKKSRNSRIGGSEPCFLFSGAVSKL